MAATSNLMWPSLAGLDEAIAPEAQIKSERHAARGAQLGLIAPEELLSLALTFDVIAAKRNINGPTKG
jgi:hypothetical protein